MHGKRKLVIEPAWCKGCGICVAFCPGKALELLGGKAHLIEDGECVRCGLCELRCPDYAIYLVNEEE